MIHRLKQNGSVAPITANSFTPGQKEVATTSTATGIKHTSIEVIVIVKLNYLTYDKFE
jgi:hypothetical protein